MYSSVKEIGTPTKMMPIMLASMISPRISLPVIVDASARSSDQDLLAMHQLPAGACRPQRLQQLRDALREHQQGRERNDGAERPDDRTPQAEGGALVDRVGVDQVVDGDREDQGHDGQEQQQVRDAVDDPL